MKGTRVKLLLKNYFTAKLKKNTIFIREALHAVKNYFIKNWHHISEEWITGLTFNNGNFLNATNNRLESINSQLKSLIPTFSNLSDIFKQLFVVLRCVRRG